MDRIKERNPDQHELLLVAGFVECLATSAPLFHRSFVDEYFHNFREEVQQTLFNSSKQQLRHLKKEKVDKLVEHLFEKLVLREKEITTANAKESQSRFIVDLGIHFLKQDFLEKRIDGIKIIGSTALETL